MKLTSDELLAKVNDAELDNDTKIALMEDISDTLNTDEINAEIASLKAEVENLTASLDEAGKKYEELQERFKARFFEGKDGKDEVIDEVEEEKDEVIDIKEI